MTKNKKNGFTIIEIIVVIAIISVLSSIVMAGVNNMRTKARDARRVADFRHIQIALVKFYEQFNRYPMTSGGPFWDDHWEYFQDCLQTGNNCGFTTTGYQPVMAQVPNDPLDDPNTSSDSDPTYYTGWEGRTEQNYTLRAYLENANNPALQSDADGGWRSAGDGGCDDPWYCIKQNWPF